MACTGPETRPKQPKRPFEDEDDESCTPSLPSRLKQGRPSGSVASIFGDEGPETDMTILPFPKASASRQPFADEEGESSGASSTNDEMFQVKKETVFSFGWSSVASFQKATFWREQMDDEKAQKPKRAYDNSKRSKAAAYSRTKSRGFYKRNGLDPSRLEKLFATNCLCACGGIRLQEFSEIMFRSDF